MDWPLNTNINENVQPIVDHETATKYSATLFVNSAGEIDEGQPFVFWLQKDSKWLF